MARKKTSKRKQQPQTVAVPSADALFTQLIRKQITLDQWAAAMDQHYPITAIVKVGEFEWKPANGVTSAQPNELSKVA